MIEILPPEQLAELREHAREQLPPAVRARLSLARLEQLIANLARQAELHVFERHIAAAVGHRPNLLAAADQALAGDYAAVHAGLQSVGEALRRENASRPSAWPAEEETRSIPGRAMPAADAANGEHE